MSKICKIVVIFIIIIAVYATIYTINASDIWSTGKKFLGIGQNTTGMTQENVDLMEKLGVDTKAGFKELIDFLWSIGLLVVFVSTVILGIKYMLVMPSERSRIKESTIPYVIGVVIIFGALTIWKFIIYILDGSL